MKRLENGVSRAKDKREAHHEQRLSLLARVNLPRSPINYPRDATLSRVVMRTIALRNLMRCLLINAPLYPITENP